MQTTMINCRKWPQEGMALPQQAPQPLTMLDRKMMLQPTRSTEEVERRLMKLQALEDCGVGSWAGFPDAMDHFQDILRVNEPDKEDKMPPVAVPVAPVPEHLVTMVGSGSYKEDLLSVYAIEDVAMEECAEVIQAISKIRRFGMYKNGYDNKKNLTEEIGQLYAALDLLTEAYELNGDDIEVAANFKMKAIHTWAPYYERNREDI